MNFLSYSEYILESEKVELEKDLREYSLTHVKDSFFQLKSNDFYRDFNVLPYKNEEIEKLKSVYRKLEKSVESLNTFQMFDAIEEAERLSYNYGGIYNSKFQLNSVPELTVNLDSELVKTLNSSPREFVLNDLNKLNKNSRELLGSELRERAEVLCCVIEALFYYIRTVDKENFYKGMNQEEILEEYNDLVKKASKEITFSYEGPFRDVNRNEISKDARYAIWLCEKDLKKFTLRATILPKELAAEENIGGTQGMKFSILKRGEETPEDDFNFFPVEDLASRVSLFHKKMLKK
jgi:hypothetical protein